MIPGAENTQVEEHTAAAVVSTVVRKAMRRLPAERTMAAPAEEHTAAAVAEIVAGQAG